MNGKIEIRSVNLGRQGLGPKADKPCIENVQGKWLTVKAIVLTGRGGLSDSEVAEEFELQLADVLAAKSYSELYPWILE